MGRAYRCDKARRRCIFPEIIVETSPPVHRYRPQRDSCRLRVNGPMYRRKPAEGSAVFLLRVRFRLLWFFFVFPKEDFLPELSSERQFRPSRV